MFMVMTNARDGCRAIYTATKESVPQSCLTRE